ncbi:ribokinase, partial [Burkholderia pseudomallei]
MRMREAPGRHAPGDRDDTSLPRTHPKETIAVIGSNMVDHVTYVTRMPPDGETLEAPNIQLGCGGNGANQA